MKKEITASEMAHKSWEARIKKYGEEGAKAILLKAAKKGAERAKRGKNGRFEKK